MSSNDWQFEMHHLLEIFERESITSLRRISRCFVAMDRPFDEKFRRYFLNVSNIRLDSSFRTVQFEQCAENNAQVTAYSNAPIQGEGSENASNTNNPGSAVDHGGSLNTTRDGDLLKVNAENNVDETIEALESDDEGDGKQCGMQASHDSNGSQMEPNASIEFNNGTDNFDGEHINQDSNNENGVAVIQIHKSGIGEEDLPSDGFDANNVIVRSHDALISESLENQDPSGPSSSKEQKQSKHAGGKRFKCNDCSFATRDNSNFHRHLLIHQGVKPFKCEVCDYAARRKEHLVRHQQVHQREKAMGIVRDPIKRLFKCTLCDQQFMKWERFTVHLAKSHKNNQRLFNCMHCLRRFTQKTEKERHEVRCKRRRFECYLCKNYVFSKWSDMQRHMRTHSDARPFQCAICHRCFRHKTSLKSHLSSVHSRI